MNKLVKVYLNYGPLLFGVGFILYGLSLVAAYVATTVVASDLTYSIICSLGVFGCLFGVIGAFSLLKTGGR